MIFIKSLGFVSSVSYISPNRGRPFLYLPHKGSAESLFVCRVVIADFRGIRGRQGLVMETAATEQDSAIKPHGNVYYNSEYLSLGIMGPGIQPTEPSHGALTPVVLKFDRLKFLCIVYIC